MALGSILLEEIREPYGFEFQSVKKENKNPFFYNTKDNMIYI